MYCNSLCGIRPRELGLFILLVESLFFKKKKKGKYFKHFPDYKLIPSVGKKKFNIDVCESEKWAISWHSSG